MNTTGEFMSLFHAPIIEAIDNFIRNPSDTKQLYDDVESFCLKNIKSFGSDQNSILKTVAMYEAINDHIATVNIKNYSKTIADKIQIPRFIQAVLFKESVRTTTKLRTCSVKQFQEILFYYENRLGGTDYKSYQSEFQSLFGKVYLAMTEEDRETVEKLISSEDLTYRLKKLMKAAVHEVHTSIVGRSNVAESLAKSLQSEQSKVASPEQLKQPTTKPVQKTTAKKSQNKPAKADTTNQPSSMSDSHLKEAQSRMSEVTELLKISEDSGSCVDLDGVPYQPYQLSQIVQSCVDFSNVFSELSKHDLLPRDQILLKMILQSDDASIRRIIIDSVITKFFDQVVSPVKDQHTAVDPLRSEFDTLKELVDNLQGGIGNIMDALNQFNDKLKKVGK